MTADNSDRVPIPLSDLEPLITSPDHLDEIMDPLTGELVPTIERERMRKLHGRLEEVALELLATCRQIRTALGEDDRTNPRLTIWSPESAMLRIAEESIS